MIGRSGLVAVPPWVTLGLGLAISVAAFLGLQDRQQKTLDFAFQDQAEHLVEHFRTSVETGPEAVHSLRAFLTVSQDVARQDFQLFASDLLARHPEIKALSWNPNILASERVDIEAATRAEGFPDFRLTQRSPSGDLIQVTERDHYVAVLYIEPFSGNETALGFDIASNPDRLVAIQASRDTGEVAATGRILLVQEDSDQFGTLVMLPVYEKGQLVNTVEQRQQHFKGVIVGVYNISDLVREALSASGDANDRFEVFVFDQSAPIGQRLLYPSGHSAESYADISSELIYSDAVELAGRKWRVAIRPSEVHRSAGMPWIPLTALIAGLIITGLLFAYLQTLLKQRAMIEQTVQLRTQELKNVTEALRETSKRDEELARSFEQRVIERTSELERSEQRLKNALEIAKLGYYVWDLEKDRCTYCTDQYAAIHGMTVEDYLAHAASSEDDHLFAHPDDRERYKASFPDMADDNTPVSLEYRLVGRDGKTRHVREIELPVQLDNGHPTEVEGTLQDITESVEMEEKLNQAIKMEAIGNLTGGIAHDFNNLMAVILGNLELLKEIETPEEREELTNAAIAATLKGADLTKNMLSFARKAPLKATIVDLNGLVQGLGNWVGRTIPENIAVETSLFSGLWKIEVDANATESALLNLLLNARDAMPNGGRLTIETANVQIDDDYVASHKEDIAPGNYVMLAVSDTGIGVADADQPRIFEPFFSTKPPGSGSGLGLSMVQGFMKQSGGTVSVYSEIGVGTTVKLYFSASGKDLEFLSKEHAHFTGAKSKGARLLVVEDEVGVLQVITEMLRKAGYDVQSAQSGDHALNIFTTDTNFDLLLTDVVMPGEHQGPHLAKRLREIKPSLPVVFMSGYASEATMHGNGLRAEDTRLMKPVRRADLIAAIEKALSIAE